MARSFHSVKYYLCLFAVLALAALFEVGVFDMETSQISDGNMKKRFAFGNSEVCDLRTPSKAMPVVLFALGRSGSSITWTTLTSLAGKENIAYEVTGGNKEKNVNFFKDLEKSPNKDQNWLISSLCNVRNFRKDIQNASVYGIQWKPYRTTWDEDYAIEGLRAASKYNSPEIKAIFLHRNPLDRRLSNERHTRSKESDQEDVSAHCEVGDEKCIEQHSNFAEDLSLPVGQKLLHFVKKDERMKQSIRDRLDEVNMKYVEVSYEKLFNEDNANEWMRIFSFLGVGPSEGLTMNDVRSTFKFASTHTKSRNETIVNFEGVKQTLVGTPYEYVLSG